MEIKEVSKLMTNRGYIEMNETRLDGEIISVQYTNLPKRLTCIFYPKTHSFIFSMHTKKGGFSFESGKMSGIEIEEHFRKIESMFLEYAYILREYDDNNL